LLSRSPVAKQTNNLYFIFKHATVQSILSIIACLKIKYKLFVCLATGDLDNKKGRGCLFEKHIFLLPLVKIIVIKASTT
jgi:hypothetical protein